MDEHSTDQTVWKQLANLSKSQYELDQYMKCLHIESAWKLWKQRVEIQRAVREYKPMKDKKNN